MRVRKLAKAAVGGVAAVVLLIQFIPAAPRINPPVARERSFEQHLNLTPEAENIMQRACMDCHSYETKWPWYSRIAPVSWMIARDVEHGRRALNLSEWSVTRGRRADIAATTVATMCIDARNGRMPRFPYAYVHPEARLSKQDLDTFCGWTQQEFARLAIEHKRRQRSAKAQPAAEPQIKAARSGLPVAPLYSR